MDSMLDDQQMLDKKTVQMQHRLSEQKREILKVTASVDSLLRAMIQQNPAFKEMLDAIEQDYVHQRTASRFQQRNQGLRHLYVGKRPKQHRNQNFYQPPFSPSQNRSNHPESLQSGSLYTPPEHDRDPRPQRRGNAINMVIEPPNASGPIIPSIPSFTNLSHKFLEPTPGNLVGTNIYDNFLPL